MPMTYAAPVQFSRAPLWPDFKTPEEQTPVGQTPEGPTSGGALLCGPVVQFAADSGIYAEGDEAESFYKVISGVVRICKFLSDGHRQIAAFYGPGEIFGVESAGLHRLTAEAVNDCAVVAYRRRGLEALAAADERLAMQFFSHAFRCAERAQTHALLLGRRSAAQKLAAFLLEMAATSPYAVTIELAMTRQDIADYVGLTIETVSRTLSQFERDGIITLPSARRVNIADHLALHALNG